MRSHTLENRVEVSHLGLPAYPAFDFVPLDEPAGHDSGRLDSSHRATIKLPVFRGLQILDTQPHLVQLILKCIQRVVLFLGHPSGLAGPCESGVSREPGRQNSALGFLDKTTLSRNGTKYAA